MADEAAPDRYAVALAQDEISLLMKGLNALGGLTEAEQATRAVIAYRLGGAAFELLPEDVRGTAPGRKDATCAE